MDGRTPRLLMVDDDARLRELLHIILEDSDIEIIEAEDGERALDLAQQYRPDVVLLDISLPRMNGLLVCRHLKQDPALSHAHVLMLTANNTAETRATAAAVGADDYITKPYSPLQILHRVESCLQSQAG